MKLSLPKIEGTIRRRLLVNFRVDPDVVQRMLPAPFRPKLHHGHAIAEICLIRLEHIRPAGFPRNLGFSSENAAHRVAVLWEQDGVTRDGVYIPRRDSSSLINRLVGGRLFPGEHQPASFDVLDDGTDIGLGLQSRDGSVNVEVKGRTASSLPAGSTFESVLEASQFFETGSLGYSETRTKNRLDGIELRTKNWSVTPLEVEHVRSSFFDDRPTFPEGSVAFDCALLMRDIDHSWHMAKELYVDRAT